MSFIRGQSYHGLGFVYSRLDENLLVAFGKGASPAPGAAEWISGSLMELRLLDPGI